MTSTRKKMYESNARIKKFLVQKGFTEFYSFPHLRWTKDYILQGSAFDAFAWKDGKIWFLQFKTNHKAPKAELAHYQAIQQTHDCMCGWVTTIKGSKEILFQHV